MKVVRGIIKEVKYTMGMHEYTLDSGFSWLGNPHSYQVGDRVEVKPLISGSIKVSLLEKANTSL